MAAPNSEAGPSQSSAPQPPQVPAYNFPAAPRAPLNVKDALSYLDEVKAQFNTSPEVYNQFLDIMKDFKTNVIETPTVINRVVALFKGRLALIQGFNTFLPPGYRIECYAPNAECPDGFLILCSPGVIRRIDSTTDPKLVASAKSKPAMIDVRELPRPQGQLLSQAEYQQVSKTSYLVLPVPAPKGVAPPPEFNQAVEFVNQIKKRFSDDNNATYNKFLAILHGYQIERKSISEVHQEVEKLFAGCTDLLEGFQAFLPDTPLPAQGSQGPSNRPYTAGTIGLMGVINQAAAEPPGSVANRKRAAPGTNKPRPTLEEPAAKKKRTSGSGPGQLMDTAVAGSSTAANAQKAKKKPAVPGQKDILPYDSNRVDGRTVQSLAPGIPATAPAQGSSRRPNGAPPANAPPSATVPPPSASASQRAIATSEELAFFDRVSRFVNDKTTYHEFLKLLNLYTQDVIDLAALVARAHLFLSPNKELWNEFREMVGWKDGIMYRGAKIQDGKMVIENQASVEYVIGPTAKGDRKNLKTCGPSYRQLPESARQSVCSGRDPLCHLVLNDEWISHPTWASEEGFIPTRKNDFEAALHRSEEERHEYDYYIESNLRAIALMEPIAQRIACMLPDEKEHFRLKPGLGNHQSKSSYHGVIKKVYGQEAGLHVIQAIHDNPCLALPIVLARLKQKDEEWKRALREWNRVWREADAKNFYRALDPQGINIKAADKKLLTPRALVVEIEVARRQQQQRRIAHARGSFLPDPPHKQMEYKLSNESIIFDILKLLLSYLDRIQGTFAEADKDRMEEFIRSFFPALLCLPPAAVESNLTPVELPRPPIEHAHSDVGDNASEIGNASATEEETTQYANRRGGKKTKKEQADLRRKALRKAGNPADRAKRGGTESRAASPASITDSPNLTSASVASSREPSPEGDMMMSDVRSEGGNNGLEGSPMPESGNDDMMLDTVASPLLRPVPATAAGLESMEGVETISTAPQPSNTELGESHSVAPPAEGTTEQADTQASTSNVRMTSPIKEAPAISISHQSTARRAPADSRNRFNFFCDSTHYFLIRMFQIVYQRLETMHQTAHIIASSTESYPPLEAKWSLMVDQENGSSEATADHYYAALLTSCEELLGGQLDNASFEEKVRNLFGIKAYHVFTIDRLLLTILKTIHTFLDTSSANHSTNTRLIELLHADRIKSNTTSRQQTTYRQVTDSAVGAEENLYRIEWAPYLQSLSFQLLGKDEVLPEDEELLQNRWESYMKSFMSHDTTEGIDKATVRKSFLKRNLPKQLPVIKPGAHLPSDMRGRSGLRIQFCIRTLRMFLVRGGEDWLCRIDNAPAKDQSAEWLKQFEAWRAKQTGHKEDVEMGKVASPGTAA